MTTLRDRLLTGFSEAFGGRPALIARAPGRVNLIGEHTDYNDGFALPVALSCETRIAARRRDDGEVRVVAADYGAETDSFAMARGVRHAPEGGWRDYVRAVFATLAWRGRSLPGMDIAIAGDIPKGTGLSSSASLQVALARLLWAMMDEPWNPITGALTAQAAENDFVGMRCGNLDQLASAGARAGAALLIDCRSLTLKSIPLPADAAIVIVQSGVERGLVEGHYNRRRAACEAAATALGVTALRDADLPMLERARPHLEDEIYRCARHIITDNLRTLAATEALARDDLVLMGQLMAQSHASMRDDFRITVAETDRLVDLLADAIGEEGGARQTGGGFGGAVVAMVRQDKVERVADAVRNGYRTPAGEIPSIMKETARAGASILPA
jgi:galactokinase